MTLPARDTRDDPCATQGLCPTCRHSETCIYLQRAEARAVWHCELFDDGRELRRAAALFSEPALEVTIDSDPLRGLCADCEVRDTCTLRPPRGGVWHCEEYR